MSSSRKRVVMVVSQVLMNAQGQVLNSSIDGSIQMKS